MILLWVEVLIISRIDHIRRYVYCGWSISSMSIIDKLFVGTMSDMCEKFKVEMYKYQHQISQECEQEFVQNSA